MNTRVYKALLRELVDAVRDGKAAVFCGAGISIRSGIPMVVPLVRRILNDLQITTEQRELVLQHVQAAENKHPLPFESFFEALLEGAGTIDQLLEVFRLGSPNTNHILMARLAKKSCLKTICTTNFDCLIEVAFEREGLRRGIDYNVFATEEQFKAVDWKEDRIRLFKLHGSVDDPQSMAITLRRVSKRALSPGAQSVIRQVFADGAHDYVAVFGYSCSDVFDVTPQIKSLDGRRKRVVLIDHYPAPLNQDKKEGQCEDIRLLREKNPFRAFDKGSRIFISTDRLIRSLWKSTMSGPYIRPGWVETAWEAHVEAWAAATVRHQDRQSRFLVAGLIFSKIGENRLALEHFEHGADVARERTDENSLAEYYGNQAIVLERLGEYKRSQMVLEEALDIAQKSKKAEAEERFFGTLGNLHWRQGRYRRAGTFFEQALEMSRSQPTGVRATTWMGNLALVHWKLGEFDDAKSLLERALQLARQLGDKEGEERHLGNIGMIYEHCGEYRAAKRFLEGALRIARYLGDIQGEGRHLCNLGNILFYQERYHESLTYYERAIELARRSGNRAEVGIRLGNLANNFNKICDYERAEKYNLEALRIAEEIGDISGKIAAIGNLGTVSASLGEFGKAEALFAEALTLATEIGDSAKEAEQLGNLGENYDSMGDGELAASMYEEALKAFSRLSAESHPRVRKLQERLWEIKPELARSDS